jgi:acetyltransferase-like isoleucine patch superfamily enzyme
MIACYLLHLFFAGLITRWFWQISEKKSPSKDGIIPRNFPSRTLNFYHIRSFLIKYPKNEVVKGAFPWLTNWVFNFVGTDKIGKGTTMEEQLVGDKFCEIGNNCYVGSNSSLATHLVEGIFGNVIYFKIKLGNNVTLAASNTIAPGCEFGSNSYLLPTAATSKYNKAKGNNFYFGMPLRKIFKRKIMEYLQLSEDDLKKDEELRKKQQESQIKGMKKS